ncbi:MAG: L-rhamnose mutarotase [Planctomycetota bacterium]
MMSPFSIVLLGLPVVAGLAGCRSAPAAPPARYAMVIGLKPDRVARYEELHAQPWPGVLERISACHIQNYSIHLVELEEGKHYLFGYFEYTGDDFAADMARMAEDAETKRWWKETDPCQQPIPTAAPGEWWSPMKEVFYHR